MNDTIEILPITTMDVEALRAVALRAYQDHYLHLWHDGGEWYMHKSFSASQLASELNDSNARFYIIALQNETVGFLKLNIDAPFQDITAADALELERIYLTKAASGKRVGSAVVGFVFGLAATLHKKTVWLKVMDSSANAIAFYTKQGFAICGAYQLGFEKMKEELRGMYVMKRMLG